MEEFHVKLSDEPEVILSKVRKMLNDFGEHLVDYSKDENYLMELADLYERILDWEKDPLDQGGQLISASDFFDASEINKIIGFMFSNFNVKECLKSYLSSVSNSFYWKYNQFPDCFSCKTDITNQGKVYSL